VKGEPHAIFFQKHTGAVPITIGGYNFPPIFSGLV
jgi:hypothetical protein